MKNHIDSNFAIAIIALVSACVGFAFWLNVQIGQDSSENVIPAEHVNKNEQFAENEKNAEESEKDESDIESSRLHSLKATGSNELLKGGEVYIEDISRIKGYPSNVAEGEEVTFGSLYLWGESTDKRYLGFSEQPLGGGVFYSPIYYLDTEDLERGFVKDDSIFIYPFIDTVVSPDGVTAIGQGNAGNDNVVMAFNLDFLTALPIVELDKGRTFFVPGHYGDDPFYPEWRGEDIVVINDYDKDDILAEDVRTDYQIGEGWFEKNRSLNVVELDNLFESSVVFDSCGGAEKYSSNNFFSEMIGRISSEAVGDPVSLIEGCLDVNRNIFIAITSVGIYKYDIGKSQLTQAEIEGDGVQINPRFGKRYGNIVPILSGYGEFGCSSEIMHSYLFNDNTVKPNSVRFFCVESDAGEAVPHEYTNYEFGYKLNFPREWKQDFDGKVLQYKEPFFQDFFPRQSGEVFFASSSGEGLSLNPHGDDSNHFLTTTEAERFTLEILGGTVRIIQMPVRSSELVQSQTAPFTLEYSDQKAGILFYRTYAIFDDRPFDEKRNAGALMSILHKDKELGVEILESLTLLSENSSPSE